MGALAWTMMGLAIWHFTIFLPDRFWAGIVGAFVGSLIGANVAGFIINGFVVPGQHSTHVLTALDAVPGALVGIAIAYAAGVAQERQTAAA
jgi:predicted membrane-bound spermidine synthase